MESQPIRASRYKFDRRCLCFVRFCFLFFIFVFGIRGVLRDSILRGVGDGREDNIGKFCNARYRLLLSITLIFPLATVRAFAQAAIW